MVCLALVLLVLVSYDNGDVFVVAFGAWPIGSGLGAVSLEQSVARSICIRRP